MSNLCNPRFDDLRMAQYPATNKIDTKLFRMAFTLGKCLAKFAFGLNSAGRKRNATTTAGTARDTPNTNQKKFLSLIQLFFSVLIQ